MVIKGVLKRYLYGNFREIAKVDVVEKEALKNPIRREKILSTREIIYAA